MTHLFPIIPYFLFVSEIYIQYISRWIRLLASTDFVKAYFD